MIRELIITAALFVFLASYLCYARRTGTYINALTPRLLLEVPLFYILEIAYLHYTDMPPASVTAYLYIYACYALGNLVTTYVLIRVRIPEPAIACCSSGYRIRFFPYLLMLAAYLLYLPILIAFWEHLLSPRMIYVLTRTGYGVSYFFSTTLAYLSFILLLFRPPAFRGERQLFFILCTLLAFLHGSKAQVVTFVFIWMLHAVYIGARRTSFRRFGIATAVFAFGLSTLFYSFTIGIKPSDMFKLLSYYSDYSRNAMIVIDDDYPTKFGQMTLEDNLWSRIPRAVMPLKPKDFGSFALSAHYFPFQFQDDAGAAAFGLGTPYADFKQFAVVAIVVWSAVSAWLLKLFILRTERNRHPADFIMLLFFAGIGLIPIGVGYLLPEHLLLALFLLIVLRLELRCSTRTSTASNRPPATPAAISGAP